MPSGHTGFNKHFMRHLRLQPLHRFIATNRRSGIVVTSWDGDDGEERGLSVQRLPARRRHRLCLGRHLGHRLPPVGRQKPFLARIPAHSGKDKS